MCCGAGDDAALASAVAPPDADLSLLQTFATSPADRDALLLHSLPTLTEEGGPTEHDSRAAAMQLHSSRRPTAGSLAVAERDSTLERAKSSPGVAARASAEGVSAPSPQEKCALCLCSSCLDSCLHLSHCRRAMASTGTSVGCGVPAWRVIKTAHDPGNSLAVSGTHALLLCAGLSKRGQTHSLRQLQASC